MVGRLLLKEVEVVWVKHEVVAVHCIVDIFIPPVFYGLISQQRGLFGELLEVIIIDNILRSLDVSLQVSRGPSPFSIIMVLYLYITNTLWRYVALSLLKLVCLL